MTFCELELAADQVVTIATDLEKLRAHVLSLLTRKLAHWRQLPWLLSGIAHYDPTVAQRIANDAIDAFDRYWGCTTDSLAVAALSSKSDQYASHEVRNSPRYLNHCSTKPA